MYILKKMTVDLDRLIRALEIYISEFINKIEVLQKMMISKILIQIVFYHLIILIHMKEYMVNQIKLNMIISMVKRI